MNPSLVYWTGAFVLEVVAIGCIAAGWWRIRRGDLAGHRRRMHLAALLVGIFLLSFVLKISLLGWEDLGRWSDHRILTLRLHETLMAVALGAGIGARLIARRFRSVGSSLVTTDQLVRTESSLRIIRWHRVLGRTASVAVLLGLLTSFLVLAGMYGWI